MNTMNDQQDASKLFDPSFIFISLSCDIKDTRLQGIVLLRVNIDI